MDFEKSFNEQSAEQIKVKKAKEELFGRIDKFEMKTLDAIRSRIALNQNENLENDPEKLKMLIVSYIEKEMKTSSDADFFTKLVETSEEHGRFDAAYEGDGKGEDSHSDE